MLSQRYWISHLEGTDKCVIWDSKIVRFLGNGKGELLSLDSWSEAEDIVVEMAQRVGA